jgi:endothelin-converting enzyme/putative endopeptidase
MRTEIKGWFLLSALLVWAVLAVPALSSAQTHAPARPQQKQTARQPGTPASPAELPAAEAQPKPLKAFDLSLLDRSVEPCTDFYRFACGGWIARNPIPPDQAIWSRFHELAENNLIIERQILEKAAAAQAKQGSNQQKIGDYYASCMDEAAIEKRGLQPLQLELERIASLQSKAELPAYLAHAHSLGSNAFFEFSSQPDFKDATLEIAETDQSGLGLPDRGYYLRTDDKSVELRQQYLRHIQRMFELAGDKPAQAAAKSKAVLAIETALAKVSLDRVSRRDPARLYNPMTVAELDKLSPAFDWDRYFSETGAPKFATLNVTVPDFVKGFNEILTNTELKDIKTYLTWRLLSRAAPLLPKAFVDQNFDFFGKTLTGTKQLQARWKRCVRRVNGDMGEAVGQFYVAENFPPEAKQRVLRIVRAIEEALHNDIQDLSWMTEATRKQALVKLAAVQNKIGYPEKWRDYSALIILRGDALGNALRSTQFENLRELMKIGQPADRSEWSMSPPTVNAYYNPQENNINFPAGILQPPFFDMRAGQAVNMGGIGAIIGHELTHGFDDEGRQFDALGNLRNWWTEQDAKAFQERTQCFVDEYSSFVALDSLHLNGKLTLGENTADNGGVRLSLMALAASGGLSQANSATASGPGTAAAPGNADGFTPEQQFFVSFGQIWCTNITAEAERLQVLVDPHSPDQFRVNGVLSNMPEFEKAFACRPGSPMVREKPCRVW